MQHFIAIDLQKAHVKSHFRRDPKTGKLLFIKDYDSKAHGAADFEFHQGHKVRVNNPRSKFHDQVMEVRHYSDKYDVVRLTIPGKSHTADFEPRMLEPHSGAPAAPAATEAPAASGPMTINDAKLKLGLVGLSFVSADMQHERQRVESMTEMQLRARIDKIKSDQKLYNFMRALIEWGKQPAGNRSAGIIEVELIHRAKNKPATPAPAAQPTDPASAPAPAVSKTTFDPGDRVRINNPRSKHHGKEGVVSSFSDKYNVVRMKLDDGSYTDASPNAVANLAASNAAPAPDVKPKKDAKPKVASDFPHDKIAAWKYSTEEQRSLARVTGMVPLDKGAADYIKRNLDRITKPLGQSGVNNGYNGGRWRGNKTRTGYTIPQWANDTLNSSYKRKGSHKVLSRSIPEVWSLDDSQLRENPIAIAWYGKQGWEKAGYDYDKEIKPYVEPIQADAKKATDMSVRHKSFDVLNQILQYTYERMAPSKGATTMGTALKDHVHLDNTMAKILGEYSKQKHANRFNYDQCLNLAQTMCGYDYSKPAEQVTLRDFLTGYGKFLAGQVDASKTPGVKYDTNEYVAHMVRNSDIAKELWNQIGNQTSSKYMIGQMFCYSGYNIDRHQKAVQYLLSDGVLPDPTSYWSTHHEIFGASASTKVSDAIHDEMDKKIQNNDILRDQFGANIVAKEGSSTIQKNWDREFKARVFPKGLMKAEGPRATGVRIARMSGSVDSIVDGMSKRHWREVERQKKLKAKGVPLDKPSTDLDVPAPDHLGCTFSSVDDKTAEFVRKKIEKAWDKGGVHGGFFFKIHGIYRIGGMDHYDKFKKIEKDRDNIMFGYHSTNFALAASISKTNYRPSRSGMLGSGLYVTDVSSKSAQYLKGNCNVTRAPGTRGVFLVNKISLGKVHDSSRGAMNSKKHETPNRSEAHSIFAPKGKYVPGYSTDVKNDEHVVLDSNAAIPMYWVDMELTDRFGNTNRP